MKHTKSPWKVKRIGGELDIEFRPGVFNAVHTDNPNDIEELEANDKLIASAPEMLEALLYVAKDDGCPPDVSGIVLAAIEKAGGK